MRKTSDLLEILRMEREATPHLQKLYEEEDLKYQIALSIRGLREKFRLTQAELAKKIGTSQSAIARLEDTDYEGYSLATLQRLADVFKCRLVIKFDFGSQYTDSSLHHSHSRTSRKRLATH